MVRNAGSEEQRRSICWRAASGERLSAADVEEHTGSQRCVSDGIGFKVSGALEAVSLGEPDWFALLALSDTEALSVLLVQRGTTDTDLIRGGEPESSSPAAAGEENGHLSAQNFGNILG
ncbi:hypothetical protein I6F15_30535 [Bradyrhizobium sp. BRP14]|nr:hypothetical protein [Bradyrhizobium sp. BRP14]